MNKKLVFYNDQGEQQETFPCSWFIPKHIYENGWDIQIKDKMTNKQLRVFFQQMRDALDYYCYSGGFPSFSIDYFTRFLEVIGLEIDVLLEKYPFQDDKETRMLLNRLFWELENSQLERLLEVIKNAVAQGWSAEFQSY